MNKISLGRIGVLYTLPSLPPYLVMSRDQSEIASDIRLG